MLPVRIHTDKTNNGRFSMSAPRPAQPYRPTSSAAGLTRLTGRRGRSEAVPPPIMRTRMFGYSRHQLVRYHRQIPGIASTTGRDDETVHEQAEELLKAAGILDMEQSGLAYLDDETRIRILTKSNKFEKLKAVKSGSTMWKEVYELAELIREGKTNWEELELDDIDVRMKWAGLFHRRKRSPGKFMMRIKIPNGEVTSEQLRTMARIIAKYRDDGCADITTRAGMQLRGIPLEDADAVIDALRGVRLSSFMSGMDNVRNITGSPIAGLDPHELLDTRPLSKALDAAITNHGQGNPALANLPRKINIGISSTPDDFAHCHINDVGLKAVVHEGTVGFNVMLGGYFSVKRNTMSISGDTFITETQAIDYCMALLEVFRDMGKREDRQKTRLMWLVEALGVHEFRRMVANRMGLDDLPGAVPEEEGQDWKRRDLLGIHEQKQEDIYWVGACVPAGRLTCCDMMEIADVSDRFGDSTVRLTVEQNIIIPNVKKSNIGTIQEEPIFSKFKIAPGPLMRGLVSCTGSQFCGLGLIETKQRAVKIIKRLESEFEFPHPVRIHFTGCPNSCGQAQVADIGLMGAPAKNAEGKAVEGVRVFLGGEIGENPRVCCLFY